MSIDVKVPPAGESISEGVLVEWLKPDGAVVAAEDPLFELETDKITMEVQAEAAGRLSISVEAGSTVDIGQVVGTIDTAVQASDAGGEQGSGSEAAGPEAASPSVPASERQADAEKPSSGAGERRLSPAVRRMVEEHGIDVSGMAGSGKDGRLTKGDLLGALDTDGAKPQGRVMTVPPTQDPPAAQPDSPPTAGGPRETRQAMSSLRRRVAERLVEVQQTAAILTTFNEVDMSALLALRARHKDSFLERHGVKLGMMSFFVQAVVDALHAVPALNARIEEDELVRNHYYDIGVAVGTERGLVVPVLRNADRMSLAQIETGIADLAQRAARGRLELKELQGGCFTISNGGVYGSLLSTPILNPPQSGILGMHAIKKRPMVVGPDDRIEARPMMYLALSYDHRLVDGKEAVTFLRRIVELIEQPERLFLQV